jgi:hypothetical protein
MANMVDNTISSFREIGGDISTIETNLNNVNNLSTRYLFVCDSNDGNSVSTIGIGQAEDGVR